MFISSTKSARIFLAILAGIVITAVGVGIFVLPPFANAGTTSSFAVSIGNYDDWDCRPIDPPCFKDDAVRQDDGNASYVRGDGNGDAQTFGFQGANVPLLSAVNSVTLEIVARKINAAPAEFALRAEQGTGAGEQFDGPAIAPGTAYATYTLVMPTNPFTGNPWTASEVNRWDVTGTNFGVVRTNAPGIVRVTKAALMVDYSPSNKPRPNSITIVKIANPQDGTDFEFTDFNEKQFFLDDAYPDDKDAFTDRVTYTNLSPGTYTFTEVMPTGWFVENLFCEGDTDGGTVVNHIQGFAQVDLDEGEEIACGFVNSNNPPS